MRKWELCRGISHLTTESGFQQRSDLRSGVFFTSSKATSSEIQETVMSSFKLLWFQTGLLLCSWPPSNGLSFFLILPYKKGLPKAFLVCYKVALYSPLLIQKKTPAFLLLQVKLKLSKENPRFFFFFIFLDLI